MKTEQTAMSPDLLKPHPLQQAFYTDLSAADLQALADDMLKNGQRDAIVVMPAGNAAGLEAFTVLDGCQRTKAAMLVGISQVKVLIRHDLKDADAAAVEAEFLKFNLLRRQLRPLQKARVALRLFLIEKKRPPGVMRSYDMPEARDRVGAAISMSGRNLDRYFNVLRTPQAVQHAVDQGLLPLVLGARVASLRAEQQEALAREIEGIRDKKAIARIVGERLGVKDSRRHLKINDALADFVRQIDRGMHDLDGRVDDVPARTAAAYLTSLTAAQHVINRLIDRAGAAS